LKSGNIKEKKTKLMQISRAAQKAGVSRQTLQYYLMVGLLEPTEVTPTGRRLFNKAAVERIQLIHKLNKSGYPLRAIRELFMERQKDTKDSKQ
jgi:DNA-binding transcriptional MerR regulator